MVKDKDQYILHIQYHCWWWPGTTRSQGICSHGINLLISKYSISSIRMVNALRPEQNGKHFADNIFENNCLQGNLCALILDSSFTDEWPYGSNGQKKNKWNKHFTKKWLGTNKEPISEPILTSFGVTSPKWVDACQCGKSNRNTLYIHTQYSLIFFKWQTLLSDKIIVQNCSESNVLTMELLQFCTKPSVAFVTKSIWIYLLQLPLTVHSFL